MCSYRNRVRVEDIMTTLGLTLWNTAVVLSFRDFLSETNRAINQYWWKIYEQPIIYAIFACFTYDILSQWGTHAIHGNKLP